MPKTTLFEQQTNIFKWKDIETFLIRTQYNEMLEFIMREYDTVQYPVPVDPLNPSTLQARPAGQPSFLNRNNCLTIEPCPRATNNPTITTTSPGSKKQSEKNEADEMDEILINNLSDECFTDRPNRSLMPKFIYERKTFLEPIPANLDLTFITNGLTGGAVLWLYYYERMGIFKILGALLDDYNYRGKYTISGRREFTKTIPQKRLNTYSILMDMISTLHRVGISSNLRDRICLYQRFLGVSIENNLGIQSEQNIGFMNTFNRLIDYTLEYYKAKQLAQAIQAQSTTSPPPRSSVATQTSIRDTITVLKQHFEPLQYGRNQINTFIGIATVHATLCLVNMLRTEIGIPTQYNTPEEFIPAAYDILVAKRSLTLNETNRFIIYDNCASYGYRLLTDIETINLPQLTVIGTGSTLDTWLNDIEGLVEGYRNAYSAVPEKVGAIV